MHNVKAVMNSATLHRTDQTTFLLLEHHATKTDLIQSIDMPTLKGTDHTSPIMVTDMGDISTNHNHVAIPTVMGAAAVSEDMHCVPYPSTAVAHAALWPMDTHIAICVMMHPTNIVTPHAPLTSSPAVITAATIPQTGAILAPAAPTTLHRKHNWWGKPSHIQDLQPPINPTVPRLSSSRTPHQILLQIQTVTLIL